MNIVNDLAGKEDMCCGYCIYLPRDNVIMANGCMTVCVYNYNNQLYH